MATDDFVYLIALEQYEERWAPEKWEEHYELEESEERCDLEEWEHHDLEECEENYERRASSDEWGCIFEESEAKIRWAVQLLRQATASSFESYTMFDIVLEAFMRLQPEREYFATREWDEFDDYRISDAIIESLSKRKPAIFSRKFARYVSSAMSKKIEVLEKKGHVFPDYFRTDHIMRRYYNKVGDDLDALVSEVLC